MYDLVLTHDMCTGDKRPLTFAVLPIIEEAYVPPTISRQVTSLFYLILSYPILSYLILPYNILSYPTLSYPTVDYTILLYATTCFHIIISFTL